MKARLIYLALFIFCTWLALATRSHRSWFPHLVVVYGGDIIWSGMFVFFLRMLLLKTPLWKLTLFNYILGVLDECSQLNNSSLMVAIRSTYFGRLMFGVGFLWSDLVCYAIGSLLGWGIAALIDHYFFQQTFKAAGEASL